MPCVEPEHGRFSRMHRREVTGPAPLALRAWRGCGLTPAAPLGAGAVATTARVLPGLLPVVTSTPLAAVSCGAGGASGDGDAVRGSDGAKQDSDGSRRGSFAAELQALVPVEAQSLPKCCG